MHSRSNLLVVVALTLGFLAPLACTDHGGPRETAVTPPPSTPRTWVVWADDLRLIEISDRPGPIVDSTAAPPLPSPAGPPPPHPFPTAGCGGDPLLCSRAGELLRASRSLEEFLAALAAEGWRVEETTAAP